ncbi:VOC family protein [Ekhidna sp.]|uniref:VOC family protein n=1 Tax=Ekhidna sp. TaxID=2608089 RepID=UPI003B503726
MKSLFTSIFVCFYLLSQAQELKPYFSAIIVEDLESSVSWYSDNLGFKLINETDLYQDRGFKQANLSNSTTSLELIQLKNAINPNELIEPKQRLRGFFKIGYFVSDFDSLVKSLQQSEVEFHGSVVKDANGKKMLIIKDPDGNKIQLFEE